MDPLLCNINKKLVNGSTLSMKKYFYDDNEDFTLVWKVLA